MRIIFPSYNIRIKFITFFQTLETLQNGNFIPKFNKNLIPFLILFLAGPTGLWGVGKCIRNWHISVSYLVANVLKKRATQSIIYERYPDEMICRLLLNMWAAYYSLCQAMFISSLLDAWSALLRHIISLYTCTIYKTH